ncbi:MAG: hypothetical protein ACR2G6_09270 [Gemmatimonadaceae bacterium]
MSKRRRSFRAAPRAVCVCLALSGALLFARPYGLAAQQAEGSAMVSGASSQSDPWRGGNSQSEPWRARWQIEAATEYDSNVFRLTDSGKERLGAGGTRYADMNSAFDLVATVQLVGELRGPGALGRKLSLGSSLEVDVHALNPLLTHVDFGFDAIQSLSSRDKLGVEVGFTPSEFQRNYLSGADLSGQPMYAAGVEQSLEGRVSYMREVLEGRRGSRSVDVELRALAGRQSVRDFPWRDRSELGGRLEIEVELARWLDMALSGTRIRAYHDGTPEPVWQLSGVTTQSLERDFFQNELSVETAVRLSRSARLLFGYEWRDRAYLAEEGVDPVYGGRVQRRNTFGGELRLDVTRTFTAHAGAAYQLQDLSRSTAGGTGDEEDFRRITGFFQLAYRP